LMVRLAAVIPWRPGLPLNIPEGVDEVIIVDWVENIGLARIEGARLASAEWLMQCDGDAYYPPWYAARAREVIESGLYPQGFRGRRVGGLGTAHTATSRPRS